MQYKCENNVIEQIDEISLTSIIWGRLAMQLLVIDDTYSYAKYTRLDRVSKPTMIAIN